MYSLANMRVFFAIIFSLSLSNLSHASFSQIVAFGDSLSDSGNVYATVGTPEAPYYDGRFSNGPVWVEVMAQQLGLAAPGPSEVAGPAATNYAWGGARTTTDSGFIPSVQNQVGTYLADTGGVADANAIYTILTGGNDVRAFDPATYNAVNLAADAQAVAGMANDLINAGAQNILILNIPDLGTAPVADGNEGLATFFTSVYNDALLDGLNTLGSSHVTHLDLFSISQGIAADPAAYGLTDAETSCLVATGGVGGAICDDFLFWDDLHPTAAGHQLIGTLAASAVVPVPTAAWLFGSALLTLVGIGRKKSRV